MSYFLGITTGQTFISHDVFVFFSQLRNGISSDVSGGMSSEQLSEYLADFPTDLYKDSSNFLSNTLRLNSLLHHDKEEGPEETIAEIDEIVKGKKEVSIPPGIFDFTVKTLSLLVFFSI